MIRIERDRICKFDVADSIHHESIFAAAVEMGDRCVLRKIEDLSAPVDRFANEVRLTVAEGASPLGPATTPIEASPAHAAHATIKCWTRRWSMIRSTSRRIFLLAAPALWRKGGALTERPRWDSNPRITDLQSVPLGHLGTRPRGCYVGVERSPRQLEFHCSRVADSPNLYPMSQLTQDSPETVIAPAPLRAGPLGPWAVVVHNDNVNTFDFVIRCLREIARLDPNMAVAKTNEIHHEGASQVTHTHREHAELICDRLSGRGLTVTVEPA